MKNVTQVVSGFCDFNIEFGHMYYRELLNEQFSLLDPAIEATSMLAKALGAGGASVSLCLMIDDYSERHDNPDRDVTKLRRYLSGHRLAPHYVAFEGDLATVAQMMVNGLNSKWITRRDAIYSLRSESSGNQPESRVRIGHSPKSLLLGTAKKHTYFEQERAKSQTEVVLAEEHGSATRFGCALLASCWALARLGMSPYSESLKLDATHDAPPFSGRNLITILPTGYLKVEATVLEILKASRDKKVQRAVERIQYYFHRTGV